MRKARKAFIETKNRVERENEINNVIKTGRWT